MCSPCDQACGGSSLIWRGFGSPKRSLPVGSDKSRSRRGQRLRHAEGQPSVAAPPGAVTLQPGPLFVCCAGSTRRSFDAAFVLENPQRRWNI